MRRRELTVDNRSARVDQSASLLPKGRGGGGGGGDFFMNEDCSIGGAGGEECAIFRMTK